MDSVFLGISVLLAASLVVTLGTVLGLLYTMPDVPNCANTTTVCLPKNLNGNDKFEFECGDSAELLHQYIQNSVESWYKQYRNKEYSADRPCSLLPDINVTLKPNIKLVGYTNLVQGKTEKVVRWDSNSDMSFNHKRHYADGYITVPTTGLYRIYSHLTFRIGNNGKLHTLSHAILTQRSNGKDVLLVNNVMPSCGTTAGEMKVPSFLESVVQLTRGDRLYVEVHAVREIMAGQENNFFGAFML